MPAQVSTGLISLLERDHQAVKVAFAELDQVGPEEWPSLFWKLTEMLARHEVAEELVVYPVLRKVPGGESIADARIAEQSATEVELARMEKMDQRSIEFAREMADLRAAVFEHAEKEELEAFPVVVQSSTADDLSALGDRYTKAKNAAPTHPHPAAPDTPPGNVVLGPVASLVDRVRDAARSLYMS